MIRSDKFEQRVPITSWDVQVVEFGNADEDLEIRHNLTPQDPEQIDVQVLEASGPPLVYKDTSATRKPWNRGIIRLRSAIPGLKARLLLTTPLEGRELLTGGAKILARGVLPGEIAYQDQGNTFSASGNSFSEILSVDKGLAFPATQVASSDAHVLDDYEEGSWTPTLSFGGASTGITYAVQDGAYIKIGKKVFFSVDLGISNKGSATGAAFIDGLPFTPGTSAANRAMGAAGWYSQFSGLTGGILFLTHPTQASIQLFTPGAAAATGLTDANFTSNSRLLLEGFYQAAN